MNEFTSEELPFVTDSEYLKLINLWLMKEYYSGRDGEHKKFTDYKKRYDDHLYQIKARIGDQNDSK